MGGCASRPKDLALDAHVPAEDPAKTVPEPVAETVPQESNGGEEKKEEPLIDISAPETTAEPETSEATPEEKPKEEAAEQKVEQPAKKPEAEEVAPKSEEKTEAVPAPVA